LNRGLGKALGVGIDFGTSKSCAAVLERGSPVVITDSTGHRTLPSVVLVDPDDKLHIGWDAVNNPLRYRSRSFTISSVKRLMGTGEEMRWGTLKTHPQEISALIIALLKSRADAHCDHDVQAAVIAVPAHYDIHQRWATLQAAEIAGFSRVRLLNEATAAVLAYKNNSEIEESVLVFDFGAGTLDVSVVEWGQGVAEVKASAGDDRLGGDDFDQLIVAFALEAIGKEIGKVELGAFQKLVLAEAARQAKIELTGSSETTLFLPGFVQTSRGPVDLNLRLDRPTFETLGKPLMERAKQVLNQALIDSGLSRTRPSKLLLIGGTSRIPYVRNMVKQIVGLEAITGLDPESGVCEGACILSGVFNGSFKDLLLLDVTPTSYSVGLKDDAVSVLIPRNTSIPTKKSASFTTTEDNQTELTVRIFQGEKQKTSQNSFVGQVRLTGLPPAKSGTPAIEVCFDIDADGTLRASASDGATGKNVTALLESPYRLNPAQLSVLQRKVQKEIGDLRDAEANRRNLEAEADVRGEARRSSEAIANFLQEFGNHLPNDSKALLDSGKAVVGEYLAANASAADISVLAASLRSTFEDVVVNLLHRELKSISESQTFAEWLHSASNKRSRTGCLSAIAELKESSRVHLDLIASLLRGTNSSVLLEKLTISLPASFSAVSIFIVTQFFGFRPGTVHLRAMRESNRELLRILVLAQLARASGPHFGTIAGQALRDEFRGTNCLFLLEYLFPETDPDLRSAVEDCLRQMPLGTWRKAWQECDYRAEFITKSPIAGQEIIREIVETLRGENSPELQLTAIDDLRKIGVENCGSAIKEIVGHPLDLEVKSRLLLLLDEWRQPEVIPLLFLAIADGHRDVSRVAVSALQKRESELPSDLVPLLRVAERVVAEDIEPSWRERFILWRLGRKHMYLRNLIRFLVANRRAKPTVGD
jgi:molecular chaperone DnaK